MPVGASALLAAIVESSNDAIISKDLTGTITSWNKAAEKIFGYKASEVIGCPISVIIPPDRGGEELDILRRISQGERIEHFETVRVRKDGRRIEVSVTISPLVQDGRIIGASKVARDITEWKRLARSRDEERARLQVTLSSIGDAVVVTDVNGAVTFMNRVAEGLTGWASADAIGEPLEAVFRIVNETSRRRVENPVSRALREGIVVGLANHTILLAKNGTEYAIDDSAAPIRDAAGEILGVVLVFRDVSGARAAEDYRSRLAAIVESSEDAIISKDLSGRIMSWNAGATRMFGYTAEEAVGKPTSILIPADRLIEETHILDQLRRGERIEHYETVRLRKDRRKVDVSITVSPIRDPDGNVIGASKIARDISDKKRTERELIEARVELQKHSRELEMKVGERTAELREAVAQLETFSYSISHDLRAPLRAIHSFIEVVLNDHAKDLPKEGRELLARVMRSSKRLALLIEQVLSSSQSRLTPAMLASIDLGVFVPSIVEDYPNLRAHRDSIIIRQPLAPVLGTEPLLTQCIANLLNNAIKFASPMRQLAVEVWSESVDEKVRCHVRDNGIGIAAADLPRVFDSFARGENSSGIEGNGLGLAVVKRAVLRMGGAVGVDSTPDVGSDFWIELAAATEPVGAR